MELFLGCLGLTVLALALLLATAAFNDSWGLRLAAILIARTEARRAWRKQYAETLEIREREFELPRLRLQQPEIAE